MKTFESVRDGMIMYMSTCVKRKKRSNGIKLNTFNTFNTLFFDPELH